jgi:hypothetical protein
VKEARDVGINEFVVRPLSLMALMWHVYSATQVARAFIIVEGYVGPDRRRGKRGSYQGRERRREEHTDSHLEAALP